METEAARLLVREPPAALRAAHTPALIPAHTPALIPAHSPALIPAHSPALTPAHTPALTLTPTHPPSRTPSSASTALVYPPAHHSAPRETGRLVTTVSAVVTSSGAQRQPSAHQNPPENPS